MNRWNVSGTALLLALLLQPLAAQNAAVSAEKLLARAQHKASVKRDLRGAIRKLPGGCRRGGEEPCARRARVARVGRLFREAR